MTTYQTEVLRTISLALASPRDRYGRPVVSTGVRDSIRKWLQAARGKARAPHGGRDTLDQCSMLLQGLLGEPVLSVMDLPEVQS
jgi:hypothetical protein